MLRMLKGTLNLICKPNPKKYPPHSEDSNLLFQQNKLSLIFHLAITIIPVSLISLIKYSAYFSAVRISLPIAMLVVFIATCRSYVLLGQIFNTILAHLVAVYLINQPEGVFFQLNVAYMTPIFLFLVTNNPYISAASSTFHTIMLLLKFKQNLLNTILWTDPDYFVNKFVNGFVISFVAIEVIYIMVFITLNKRTLELSRATKAAKDALEQQKTFVYSFSHEMRNPMNSLLGNIDLVLMTNVSMETRNMLNIAKTCGILLLNHINTILDVGKMELAKLEVKPTPTKVHDVLQRVWAISCDLIAQKGLRNHLKIEKKVPPLLMLDSHRLSQVLLNLLGNATKFTQKGSITLTVQWIHSAFLNNQCFEPRPYDEEDEGIFEKEENMSFYQMKSFERDAQDYFILNKTEKEFDLQGVAHPEQASTGVLKIIIKDTGCGISHDEMHKLFSKFSQVGNDTYQRSLGTGLGLYISKEICRSMNGEIRVYSKPKVGTTFIVCIPTTALPTNQLLNPVNSLDHMIEALRIKKLKVIVADDSPFNVNLVSNFCGKFYAQVVAAANNGLEAYEKYVQNTQAGITVDIVTLDIDMPVMDGKEACEKIRQYERENNVRPAIILLISGNYEVQQVSEMIGGDGNRKADSFMRKPLLLGEFCYNLYKHVYNVEA